MIAVFSVLASFRLQTTAGQTRLTVLWQHCPNHRQRMAPTLVTRCFLSVQSASRLKSECNEIIKKKTRAYPNTALRVRNKNDRLEPFR